MRRQERFGLGLPARTVRGSDQEPFLAEAPFTSVTTTRSVVPTDGRGAGKDKEREGDFAIGLVAEATRQTARSNSDRPPHLAADVTPRHAAKGSTMANGRDDESKSEACCGCDEALVRRLARGFEAINWWSTRTRTEDADQTGSALGINGDDVELLDR